MSDVTRILSQVEQGDARAAEELLPLVYEELRRLAVAKMAQEKPGQTLQSTALVHEAYLRLVDVDKAQRWNSWGHFYCAAAEAMRRILVENDRKKCASKRGADHQRVQLADFPAPEPAIDVVALDAALEELAEKHPQKAHLVSLRYFAGCSLDAVTVLVTDDGQPSLSHSQSYTLTVDAAATELVYTSTGDPINIGDKKTVSSPINVSGTGLKVGTLTLQINLTHANPSDLTAKLISPTGIELSVPDPIVSGNYAYEYDISGVTNLDLDGTWTLQVTDSVKNRKRGSLIQWKMIVEPLSMLLADSADVGSTGSQAFLAQQDAERAAAAAFALWSHEVNVIAMPNLTVQVTDLPAGTLGWAYGNTITLDINANGAGWYVDLNAPAVGRIDLLTVVTHEIGHLLGYGHSEDIHDVMAATLPVETRRLPGNLPVTTQFLLGSVLTSHNLRPEQRLDVARPDSVYDSSSTNDVDHDTGARIDMLLLPIAPADFADRPQAIHIVGDARILNDITDEETGLLDEDLLELIAADQK